MVLEDIQNFLSWIISLAPIIILFLFVLSWALRKTFPSIKNLFYFMIPTYIINTILVLSIGTDKINQYAILNFSTFALLLSPPIMWDTLFRMGIVENRSPLILVSLIFIIFLPIWIASRTSAGVNDDGTKKKFLKKFLSAWIIVTILGMGMINFYSTIFELSITTTFLGMPVLFWIFLLLVIIIIFLIRKRLKKKYYLDQECQLIDGEWVCPYGKTKE